MQCSKGKHHKCGCLYWYRYLIDMVVCDATLLFLMAVAVMDEKFVHDKIVWLRKIRLTWSVFEIIASKMYLFVTLEKARLEKAHQPMYIVYLTSGCMLRHVLPHWQFQHVWKFWLQLASIPLSVSGSGDWGKATCEDSWVNRGELLCFFCAWCWATV